MADPSSINFDRAAGFYDASRPVVAAELAQTLELLSRMLRSHPGERCLEIGVGTGALALPLADQAWRLTGVDISAAMLSQLIAKTEEPPPLDLVRADASSLPFTDRSFGSAYVRHVLHLVPRWRAVVAELCRVTRGTVAVALGTAPGPWHDLWYAMRAVLGPEADHVGLDFADGGDEQLRDAFAGLGAALVQESTIEYPTNETVAEFLAAVQHRSPSWTWRVPRSQLELGIEAGRRWALDRYGSLDVRPENHARKRWWIFDVEARSR